MQSLGNMDQNMEHKHTEETTQKTEEETGGRVASTRKRKLNYYKSSNRLPELS